MQSLSQITTRHQQTYTQFFLQSKHPDVEVVTNQQLEANEGKNNLIQLIEIKKIHSLSIITIFIIPESTSV